MRSIATPRVTHTASGWAAPRSNTTGGFNTASDAVRFRTHHGQPQHRIGTFADVSAGNLTNATAIGFAATVNASNKIRLGNTFVTVIEGQVGVYLPFQTRPEGKTSSQWMEKQCWKDSRL